jgi:hypothetical protein
VSTTRPLFEYSGLWITPIGNGCLRNNCNLARFELASEQVGGGQGEGVGITVSSVSSVIASELNFCFYGRYLDLLFCNLLTIPSAPKHLLELTEFEGRMEEGGGSYVTNEQIFHPPFFLILNPTSKSQKYTEDTASLSIGRKAPSRF